MFTTPTEQIATVKAWNKKYGWKFTKADFDKLEVDLPASAGLTTPVLVPYLETVQDTVEGLWRAIKDTYENTWRWNEISTDPTDLKLWQGTHEQGLRWEIIDLGANWEPDKGRTILEVRAKEQNLAHAGVLAAAAHFPDWVKSMDGVKTPHADVAGYSLCIPGREAWRDLPYLYWNRYDRRVKLSANWDDSRDCSWACPVVLRRELGTQTLGATLELTEITINGKRYRLEEIYFELQKLGKELSNDQTEEAMTNGTK